MEVSILMLPVDKIVPSPANKRKGRLIKIEELAESIKSHGLIHEPLVRPVDDHFEIVSGERRWRACSLIGETILCKVREMSDSEAHELTFAENHNREDLEPIEEAEFIQVMIQDGKSIEDIAERFGKSVQYIARRSKLINLAPIVIEECSTKLSAAQLEMLARFDHHIQESFCYQYREEIYCGITFNELKDCLDSYLMKLSSVPWKLNDETLYPDVGSCTNCQKRTSRQTSLFDQIEEKGKIVDQCIDKKCWTKKYQLFVEQKKTDLKAKNPDLITIDASGYNDAVFDNEDKEGAVKAYDVVECKKSDPGAKQALIIDGRGAGTIKYVKPVRSANSLQSSPKTLEDRYEGLTRKRLFQVLNAIVSTLRSEIETPNLITRLDDESAMSAAIIWGCRRFENLNIDAADDFHLMNSWKNYDTYTKQNRSKDFYIDLMRCVIPGWVEILSSFADPKTYSGIAPSSKQGRTEEGKETAARICKFLKIDFEELVRKAEMEIKPPKSWGKLTDSTQNTSSENNDTESVNADKKPKNKKRKSAKTQDVSQGDEG
ncbi:MAG TPA: ParB/RepB/Spo0J family partition protein [Chitinispirillaceae bacterium]|nr:ParB/RepB/Spo0J family partition protein [Chitinispirillaceae bacterium]